MFRHSGPGRGRCIERTARSRRHAVPGRPPHVIHMSEICGTRLVLEAAVGADRRSGSMYGLEVDWGGCWSGRRWYGGTVTTGRSLQSSRVESVTHSSPSCQRAPLHVLRAKYGQLAVSTLAIGGSSRPRGSASGSIVKSGSARPWSSPRHSPGRRPRSPDPAER